MLRTLDKRQKGGGASSTIEAAQVKAKSQVEVKPVEKVQPIRKEPPVEKVAPVPRQEPQRQVPRQQPATSNKRAPIEDQLPPDYGRIVWITDPVDGFSAARIIDISKSGFTLTPLDTEDTVARRYEEVFSSEDDPRKSSYVANILISINPYQTIDGFYSTSKIKEYRGKSLGQKEPHIYAIADKSYREMKRNRKSQSIIVSGESGAGKTESQKAVLRYLCENWGAEAGPIQQRLLETNPILEAFGNAKTLRNNNSSRFGKFVQIHFANNGTVSGGFVSHYLLETSRICRQSSGERNYHIFYQLIAGSSPELFKYLSLGQPHCFNRKLSTEKVFRIKNYI
uniref:Myosin motor domain-containing protein n=1 Tax=Caenorhabditis tropicalis TaxID=1561998 RepID=A0A1I7TQA3_9PELO